VGLTRVRRLPIEIARSASSARAVVAVALPGQTDPALEAEVSTLCWLHPGQAGRIVEFLCAAGVREAVLAGKLPKLSLADPAALRPDALALTLLRRLSDRHDASILSSVADHLAEHGIQLLPQAELVPELLATPGLTGECLRAASSSPTWLSGGRSQRRSRRSESVRPWSCAPAP
jgi:DUF1009 family protein